MRSQLYVDRFEISPTKMQLSMTLLISQIMLLLYSRGTIAQVLSDSQVGACMFNIRDPTPENQPAASTICESIDRFIDDQPGGRFFEALKNVESQGDFCRISEDRNKIGLYQISEEYYNEAVCFNEELALDGSVWKHVWGDHGDEYSRRVIRSYLCYHGTILRRRLGGQFVSIYPITGIHRRGSSGTRDRPFIQSFKSFYDGNGSIPTVPPEDCDPPCKVGECCMANKCWCLNTTTKETNECQECRRLQIGGLDMVFVLDASGSIGSTNFQKMKETVENIVSSLTIGENKTRVAVMVFSSSANLIFNLNSFTERDPLIEAIRDIGYTGGGTNTGLALRILRLGVLSEILGVRPENESTRIAIVITDGRSNNPTETSHEAELLRNSAKFRIYAIGIGSGIGEDELISIAGDRNTVLQVENFRIDELQQLEENISREACRAVQSGQLSEDSPVTAAVGEGIVAYYQVQIPEEGLTFMFDLEEGRVLICISTINPNPDCRDPSSYEWRCETRDYCDFHVAGSTSRKRRQTFGVIAHICFISIEGVEENNKISVDAVKGDETVSNAVAPMTLIDTVIMQGDPLYEVPVTHTPPGMDPTVTSLCYQIHGESGNYYNLISDNCIQVNVLYDAMKNSNNGNFIKEIGILAHDTKTNCTEIRMRANRCVPVIDGVTFNKSYNEDGIRIIKTRKRQYEITVPNCKASQGDDIKFEVTCVKVQDQKTVRFDVKRGSGLKPGAHGLIGQFWSIPVDVLEYSGNYTGPVNNTYVVTVDHPSSSSTPRRFIAELHHSTWDRKAKQCLYVGSAQSGAVNEADVPNDPVIEGTYDDYEVSGLFDSDFQYNQFQEDRCA